MRNSRVVHVYRLLQTRALMRFWCEEQQLCINAEAVRAANESVVRGRRARRVLTVERCARHMISRHRLRAPHHRATFSLHCACVLRMGCAEARVRILPSQVDAAVHALCVQRGERGRACRFTLSLLGGCALLSIYHAAAVDESGVQD